MKRLDSYAHLIGRGLVAGAIGTAAMTVSSSIEMRLRGRQPSDAPSRAAGKVIGVQPRNPKGAKRFGTMVHWAYGSALGVLASAIARAIDNKPMTAGAHFGSVWGIELLMLPALGIVPKVSDWGPEEIAIDAWHHLVYAAGVAAALNHMTAHQGK